MPPRGRFPVVFFELDVVLAQVNADRGQRFEVKLLHVLRRRLQDDLHLQVLEQAVGIFAITSVGGAARRLRVGDLVRIRPQNTQKSFRRHGAGAYFNIVRLLQDASPLRPKGLQAQNEFLKCKRIGIMLNQELPWIVFSSQLTF